MKSLLPNFFKKPRGFTLVELMIVIAIIAILSLIGLGIFNGAQGSARDGRRRVEIDQLAKNIESTRDPSAGIYLYTTALGAADYPNGLADPGSYVYCAAASTTSTPPTAPANWKTASCADAGATWAAIGGSPFTVAAIAAAGNDLTDPLIKSYTVCASSERTANPICKSNVIR